MKHKSSVVLLCLAALFALALFVIPGVAATGPPPNDIVTLRADLVFVGDFGEATTFTRIHRDGKTTAHFAVPSKKVLVITDLEWVVSAGIEKNVQFSLFYKANLVYAAAMNLQNPPGPDALLHGIYRDRLNIGIAMNNNNFSVQAVASNPTTVTVFLRGYLTGN